ncbi:MAG: HAD family hydrolase [Desulfobacteraceae bacterium]|nr:HAD family hydrolase [Desulfobacteraceae bacterium]
MDYTPVKIVSVDMFQTLVDLEQRRHAIWREILDGRYTRERAEAAWQTGKEVLSEIFNAIIAGEKTFIPMRGLFKQCFSIIFERLGVAGDPDRAVDILRRQHSLSRPFEDAPGFLDTIGRIVPICLTSDTDHPMLGSLKDIYPFDQVFISEEIRSYKVDPAGKLFNAVLGHYNLPARHIFHIGDAAADVYGAACAGMQTCWLNRNDSRWCYDFMPDFEVSGLVEAEELLRTLIDVSETGGLQRT